jgi:hypothetical protein
MENHKKAEYIPIYLDRENGLKKIKYYISFLLITTGVLYLIFFYEFMPSMAYIDSILLLAEIIIIASVLYIFFTFKYIYFKTSYLSLLNLIIYIFAFLVFCDFGWTFLPHSEFIGVLALITNLLLVISLNNNVRKTILVMKNIGGQPNVQGKKRARIYTKNNVTIAIILLYIALWILFGLGIFNLSILAGMIAPLIILINLKAAVNDSGGLSGNKIVEA